MRKIMLTTGLMLASTQLAMATSLEHYFNMPSSSTKMPANVLYIQTANDATLKQLDKKSGAYQLTLSNVSPMVTYFSDRPERVIGQIGNAAYLKTWNQGGTTSFDNIAPNVVVSGVTKVGEKTETVNIVMELSNPALHLKNNSITYTAKSLSSSESKLAFDAAHLHYTSVFIDGGACFACIPGG